MMATASAEGGASDPSGKQVKSPMGLRLSLAWTWLIGLFTFAALVWLLSPFESQIAVEMEQGGVAPRTVYSPYDYSFEDPEETTRARQLAAEEVPAVFLELAGPAEIVDASIEQMFAAARQPRDVTAARDEPFGALIERETGVRLTQRAASSLEFNAGLTRFERDLRRVVREVFDDRIVTPPEAQALIRITRQRGGFVLTTSDGREVAWYLTDEQRERLRSLEEAVNAVRNNLRRSGYHTPDDDLRVLLAEELARELLRPNLIYQQDKTEQRKREAAEQTRPVMIRVQAGELICSKGEAVTPLLAAKLRTLEKMGGQSRPARYVGYAALAFVAMSLAVFFLRRYHRPDFDSPLVLLTISTTVLMVLALAKVATMLRPFLPEEAAYAVPVAACGMLLTVLRSGRLAIFMVNLCAILSGVILGADWNLRYVIVLAWGGCVGVFLLTSVRARTDPYKAGLLVSLASTALIFCLAVYDYPTLAEFKQNFEPHILTALVAGFSNGFLAVGLAVLLLPLYEWALGVTTDLRLVELSSGSKTLKELAEKAPGTYHHSLMVATLAESAAEAIGANSLLCRVGALYHDIGKMNNPQYFVENYITYEGRSPHDRMTPNMSVRVLRNHVKDGLEMGKEIGLPKAILDFIPEHHGTTLITYFYAKASEDDSNQSVREEDFRYQGPKPQSIETAIVLISDSIEAASRTLDPRVSEGQIVSFVRTIINDKFMDEQFDECDLTLRQLHLLTHAFSRTLCIIMHRRIVYPKAPGPGVEGKRSMVKEKGAKADKDKEKDKEKAKEKEKPRTESEPVATDVPDPE